LTEDRLPEKVLLALRWSLTVKDIASPVRTTCDGRDVNRIDWKKEPPDRPEHRQFALIEENDRPVGVYFRGDIPEDPTNPLDPVQPVDRSTSLSPETPVEELMDSTENG